MNGWVIVYLPGGDIYQILDTCPTGKGTTLHKVIKNSIKTFLTAAQLYWWIKS